MRNSSLLLSVLVSVHYSRFSTGQTAKSITGLSLQEPTVLLAELEGTDRQDGNLEIWMGSACFLSIQGVRFHGRRVCVVYISSLLCVCLFRRCLRVGKSISWRSIGSPSKPLLFALCLPTPTETGDPSGKPSRAAVSLKAPIKRLESSLLIAPPNQIPSPWIDAATLNKREGFDRAHAHYVSLPS